jgi:hypothetical protein
MDKELLKLFDSPAFLWNLTGMTNPRPFFLEALGRIFLHLNQREQQILVARWPADGISVTHRRLAAEYGISVSAVQQIEKKAKKKIALQLEALSQKNPKGLFEETFVFEVFEDYRTVRKLLEEKVVTLKDLQERKEELPGVKGFGQRSVAKIEQILARYQATKKL